MIPYRMNPLGSPPFKKRVSYLQATGTQYIDTGITPDTDFTAEIVLSVPTSGVYMSCGSRQGWQSNEFRITPNVNQTDFAFGNAAGSYSGLDFTSFRTVLFGTDGKLYVDGSLIAERTGTFTDYFPFWLFQANGNGSPLGGNGGRIARTVLRFGSTKVRDLVPVLDKSDVPCMYDRVTNKLFYNAGTGTFTYA